MHIKNLHLENVGPFTVANLDFLNLEEDSQKLPVIIITGENGTGKSIIVDAIRVVLLGGSSEIERNIIGSYPCKIVSDLSLNNGEDLSLTTSVMDNKIYGQNNQFGQMFGGGRSPYDDNFIINYWSSKLSNDKFNVQNIQSPEIKTFRLGALSGIHSNNEVVRLITFFDYLKDSEDDVEKKIGMTMYNLIKLIIETSITEGELKYISRTKLQPVISLKGREITLDKLSSGNLYLIQRLIYLLKQIYASCLNFNVPIDDIQSTSGILLIDEAESHLHPKWQKVFLKNILELFPNLQLIVTTHSPFIVSSIDNARIYVCKSKDDYSVVEEETDFYANKPVEEILMSPLFNTSNFNEEISNLLIKRKVAVMSKDHEEIDRIEKILLDKNPLYFNYLNIENVLKSIKNEKN